MTFLAWKRKFAKSKSLREISAESGVALGTVFRALHGGGISQRTMSALVSYTGGRVSYADLVRGSHAEARQ